MIQRDLCVFNVKSGEALWKGLSERNVYRIKTASNNACYIGGKLAGQPIRIQVDNGSAATIVWSGLIQEPPIDAPTQTIVGFTGDKKTLPLVPITVNVLGQISTVDALVYDQSPVDLLLGRNCPDFRQIIYEAEGLQQTFAITRQQTRQEEAEDIQLECTNDNFDYDYPQSNLSFQERSTIAAHQTKCHTP